MVRKLPLMLMLEGPIESFWRGPPADEASEDLPEMPGLPDLPEGVDVVSGG